MDRIVGPAFTPSSMRPKLCLNVLVIFRLAIVDHDLLQTCGCSSTVADTGLLAEVEEPRVFVVVDH